MCCGKMRRDVCELAATLLLNTVKSVIQHSGCLHAEMLKYNKLDFPNKAWTDWELCSWPIVLLAIQDRSAGWEDGQRFKKPK